jgi:hypothetical protein
MTSTISGSDLNRFVNSGYLNGDYLQRTSESKFMPKSPHFHRPPNFSYNKGPNYTSPHRVTQNKGNLKSLKQFQKSLTTILII